MASCIRFVFDWIYQTYLISQKVMGCAGLNERKGLYMAPIFQKAINMFLFANKKDEGALFPKSFGPSIPIVTFALVITIVSVVQSICE